MQLEHLKCIMELNEQGNYADAAQSLYLGQNSLRDIVKNMEAELGFTIFSKNNSRIQTTSEGEEALLLMGDILRYCGEMKNLSLQASSHATSILVSPSILYSLAMPLNQRFTQVIPHGNLTFRLSVGDEIGRKLLQNEANLGLTYFSESYAEYYQSIAARYQIHVEKLLQDEYCLLVREEHPLAGKEKVSPEELTQCSFAVLDHFNVSNDFWQRVHNIENNNRFTTYPSIALILRAVLELGMIGVTSGYSAHAPEQNEPIKRIRLVDKDGLGRFYMYLLFRDNNGLLNNEQIALQCIREYFQTLSGTKAIAKNSSELPTD